MTDRITPEALEDAILLTTDTPEWHVIQKALYHEIQAVQGNAFNLKDWDAVQLDKGFCRGLMYVITLREQLLASIKQAEADDADV